MELRKPRIILYGHFGSGNIGNDSSLEAMLYAIKQYRPTAEVICICDGPEIVKERFRIGTMWIGQPHNAGNEGSANHQSSLFRKVWRRLSSEIQFWVKRPGWFRPGDQFIVVGTGAVDDMAVKHPWNAPYELYKWCSVARMAGAQVVFLSVGVGPIMNRISRVLMLRALRMAHYRSYRETAAFDYLKSVGYETKGDLLYPDLVFSLPKDSLPLPKKISTPHTVGLGLINYRGWHHDLVAGDTIYREYLAKIKCFVSWLLDQGYSIRIISGDAVDQESVQEVVEYVAREKSNQREKLIVEEISDVNGLFAQITQTEMVVASRFHNVLCSLMLERPVISLGYHVKNDFLMAEMGLERYRQHIEEFSLEMLIKQFESYTSEMEQAIQRIQQKNEHYRQLLDEQYRTILINDKKIHY